VDLLSQEFITVFWGGSSRVLRSALKASCVSICDSSIIKTLYLPKVGDKLTLSFRLLTSSIPLLDAPSISITSIFVPSFILKQFLHLLQGFDVIPSSQFKPFAKILATVVLPVPFGPEKDMHGNHIFL